MVRNWSSVLSGIALVMAIIFNYAVASAEPNQASADYIMPACRVAAVPITFSNTDESKDEVSRASLCVGIIVGLSYMGQPFGICLPVGATSQQATRVVVQYIDEHPERIQENFNYLAVEALREAWPCQNFAWHNLIDHTPVTAR